MKSIEQFCQELLDKLAQDNIFVYHYNKDVTNMKVRTTNKFLVLMQCESNSPAQHVKILPQASEQIPIDFYKKYYPIFYTLHREGKYFLPSELFYQLYQLCYLFYARKLDVRTIKNEADNQNYTIFAEQLE